MEGHKQGGVALVALAEDHNSALEVEACSSVVLVWGRSWAFALVVEHSLASALGEEEHSWDEAGEAEGVDDIEASAA